MADQINSQSAVDEAIRPSVSPTCNNKPTNQSINQLINQSINQSFVLGSFVLSVSSLLVLLIPSFVPSFIQLGAKMSLFCRSSKGSTSLAKERTSINQLFVLVLGSFGLSVGILFVFLPSFFIYSFNWCQYVLALQEQLNSSFQ